MSHDVMLHTCSIISTPSQTTTMAGHECADVAACLYMHVHSLYNIYQIAHNYVIFSMYE